jgi:hypothetical protein
MRLLNLYQLCITDAPKKYRRQICREMICGFITNGLASSTCSPPRPCSASGIVPLFPPTSRNCLSAPWSDTRSVAKARGGGYRRYLVTGMV